MSYFSRATRKDERKCATRVLEVLALIATLEHFHDFPDGQKLYLQTDHKNITWLGSTKNFSGRMGVGCCGYRSTTQRWHTGSVVLESAATRTVFLCPEEEGTVRGAPDTRPFLVTSPISPSCHITRFGRPRGVFRLYLCASASKQRGRRYRRHRRTRGRPSTEIKTPTHHP